MKKLLLMVLMLSIFCSSACTDFGEAAVHHPQVKVPKINRLMFTVGKASLEVDEKEVPAKASFTEGDIIFVPLRAISEGLGASVNWDADTQGILVQKDNVSIQLTIGDKSAKIGGVEKELPAAPILNVDTTMVPIKFIAEALGAEVSYDEVKDKVVVVSREHVEPWAVDKQMLNDAKELILEKTMKNAKRFGSQFPEGTTNGIYNISNYPNWVGGFYTGINYICYDLSGDETYIDNAKKVFPRLKEILDKNPEYYHHDLGFTFMLSYYLDYLKTGSEESKQVVIKAGDVLMGRINEPGYIRGWNVWGESKYAKENQYRMIVDSMCNIPILFACHELTGDEKYYNAAVLHARMTQKYLIRNDYTTTHTFVFTPDGKPKYQQTHQGYSDTSCWSRGHAWVINGMAITYEKTKDESFLQTAKNCTDTFLKMTDDDLIPRWDLIFKNREREPKDSSAASIIACGLMDIWEATGDDFYKDIAYKILTVLYHDYSTKDDPSNEGIILHATGHKPGGKNVDVSLIYGDYYFAQLVSRFVNLG